MVETEWCSSLWEVIYPMRLEQKEWGRKNSISHQTLQSTCLTSHQPPALIEHILHFPLATSPYRTHASLPISHQSLQSTCLTSHQPPALTEDTPHFPPATSPYRAHASLPISHQPLYSTCRTSHSMLHMLCLSHSSCTISQGQYFLLHFTDEDWVLKLKYLACWL